MSGPTVGAGLQCIEDTYTAPEKFAEIHALGLDFVEVALGTGDAEGVEASLRTLSDELRLPVRSAVVAEFVRWPERRDETALPGALSSKIDIAGRLGAEVVLVPVRLTGDPDRTAVYTGGLRALAVAAERAGVILGVEFVGGTRPDQAADLVDEIGHPLVRLYFDVGNCLHAGVDPVAGLRDLLPLVAQVHLKGGPTTPLAAMPLTALRSVLGEFTGRCCLEIEPPQGRSTLREAVAVLGMHGFWQRERPVG